ncbi:nuclease-related domain-containing protein [Aneurinibacillus aneurinilyticus]|uniref:NERD domain-containing protein n=1 Tax=Aneurinibacillus aneurinilyticus TaxID=1391 RepID=A0A848CWY0_ANEAE|nr:nuclease-related domain-containing protein [Aneurinibacillus aneurinilyticus]MED0673978.1 nuclease-related domain-containing protein [Aneurinibacillus aneurinilyticus]NME98959.1 NERD domain-containing protein [Aneurinibacillus aneurinilyticus]
MQYIMEYIAGSLFCILILCIWFLYRQRKKYLQAQQETLTKHQDEIASITTNLVNQQEQNREEFQVKLLQTKQELNELEGKLNKYISDVKAYSRNAGEIVTHQVLEGIKAELIEEGCLSSYDMLIIPNVFIPISSKQGLKTRQIDHLVLLPTGIYVIETKYWRGKIIHGLTRENAGEFSFIIDMMAQSSADKEHTIVFVPTKTLDESEGSTSIQVRSYGEPTKQVAHTAYALQSFLSDRLGEEKVGFVTPIVYFGYQQVEEHLKEILDLSKDSVARFTNQGELKEFFENEMKKKRVYTLNDLQQICQAIESINYREFIMLS